MNKPNIYKRYRFPSEIIQYAVWLYYRFNLSHRDIEDLLAERGIDKLTNEGGLGYHNEWCFCVDAGLETPH